MLPISDASNDYIIVLVTMRILHSPPPLSFRRAIDSAREIPIYSRFRSGFFASFCNRHFFIDFVCKQKNIEIQKGTFFVDCYLLPYLGWKLVDARIKKGE
jgi:hypothetical protein